MQGTLLLKNAAIVATMDDERRELTDASIFIRGNRIEAIGHSSELPDETDETIDLGGHLVLPGLINTHHHMFQSLTRVLPAAQNSELFDWLSALFPVWSNINPDMMRTATQTAMAELMLSGCTTAVDHAYLYVNGVRLDDSIEAAAEMGMRFHAARGSLSLGESQGGLPPDAVVEPDEDAVLKDMRRLIETHHDFSDDAMVQIAVAPCSPFTVTTDLMRESASLARSYGVRMHTHTAENWKDVIYSQERYGMTPAQFAEATNWVGDDVWHAHCVKLDAPGIALFGGTGTGVAHCPCSNMRLASGIAPLREMLNTGVNVGLGVDGSASNDSGDLLGEARMAMLGARARDEDPAALSAREALMLATRGGAAVLGRKGTIGQLTPGACADVIAYRLDDISMAGGLVDPLAALVFCTPTRVALNIINGRPVVRDGKLTTVDLPVLLERHNRMAAALVGIP